MNNDVNPTGVFKNVDHSTVLTYLLCTIVSVTVTAACSMMMALGVGLGTAKQDQVSPLASAAWGISGLAFLPCVVTLIALVAVHKTVLARVLGIAVIIAGILSTAGWFINSGGAMPDTTAATVIVFLPTGVALIAGAIMILRAGSWVSVVRSSPGSHSGEAIEQPN